MVPGARSGEREEMRLGTRSLINQSISIGGAQSVFSHSVSQSASEATVDWHRDAGHHRGIAAEQEQDDVHDLLLL